MKKRKKVARPGDNHRKVLKALARKTPRRLYMICAKTGLSMTVACSVLRVLAARRKVIRVARGEYRLRAA